MVRYNTYHGHAGRGTTRCSMFSILGSKSINKPTAIKQVSRSIRAVQVIFGGSSNGGGNTFPSGPVVVLAHCGQTVCTSLGEGGEHRVQPGSTWEQLNGDVPESHAEPLCDHV